MSHVSDRLMTNLRSEYEAAFPKSRIAYEQACDVLVDGISHGARLIDPYPFSVNDARGAIIRDLDGHEIVDFWQGHYANVLGHNPAVIRDALIEVLQDGAGLQTGLPEERQTLLAQTLTNAVEAEKVRLTTSGTLATMYAMMLARAHTGRKTVLKVGGGWHGANPMALKGVKRSESGYDKVESAGVSCRTDCEILVTQFNDVEALEAVFAEHGDEIACFIFEPCPGGGGFIPASGSFMRAARALTHKHGALLILDEVITGFRFCAGGVQRLYCVQPDLSTFGKVIGGGMPIAAVAGRADIMEHASEKAEPRVWFNGGTFSAHPLSMASGQAVLDHFIANESTLYPTLSAKGDALRGAIEKVFADRGVPARCSGWGNDAIAGGSLATIYFPHDQELEAQSANDLTDPSLCDHELREKALRLSLLLDGVNIMHGLGAISLAHSEKDEAVLLEACDHFAKRVLANA